MIYGAGLLSKWIQGVTNGTDIIQIAGRNHIIGQSCQWLSNGELCEHGNEPSASIKGTEFLYRLRVYPGPAEGPSHMQTYLPRTHLQLSVQEADQSRTKFLRCPLITTLSDHDHTWSKLNTHWCLLLRNYFNYYCFLSLYYLWVYVWLCRMVDRTYSNRTLI